MRKCWLICFLLCFAWGMAQTNNNDTVELVSDAELDAWLELYAHVDSIANDSIAATDTVPLAAENANSLAENVVDSVDLQQLDTLVAAAPTHAGSDTTTITIPLISPDELTEIHAQAAARAQSNPLFMDEWVATIADGSADDEIGRLRQNARNAVLRENPDAFAYHESQLPNIEDVTRRRERNERHKLKVGDGKTVKIDKLGKMKPVLSPWNYNCDAQLQFAQNYYSPNWYSGGESSLAAYCFFKGVVKYSSDKIRWDNQLDVKFSFNTAASDTLRKFRTNDDLVKLASTLGVRAFKSDKWFYSADFELSTPLFNTYVKNSYERITGPFSPLRLYLSLGLDFKYKKELSVQLLPFSYKMLHVADTTVHAGVKESIADKQGIPAGTKTKNDLGSKIKVHWEHSFMREIRVETTMSFYTNYRGIEFDWEIIGNFIINRYLSARLSLNPRYDSTIQLPDGENPRLQFKELVSLGFHYRF